MQLLSLGDEIINEAFEINKQIHDKTLTKESSDFQIKEIQKKYSRWKNFCIQKLKEQNLILEAEKLANFVGRSGRVPTNFNYTLSSLITLIKEEKTLIVNFIADMKKQPPVATPKKHSFYYVDESRIKELQDIKNEKYDLKKLIQYCKELNILFDEGCFLSIPPIVRAIMDHIPPIFECEKFSEVCGKGSQSFKESMNNLDKSLRKIADACLHTHIRKKETLPNATQVDFSNALDVLLSEVVRIL